MILQYKQFSNKMQNSTFSKMFFFVQIFYNNDPIEKSSWQKFLNTILQLLSKGFFKIIICIGVLYNFMLLRHFWGILSNQSSTWVIFCQMRKKFCHPLKQFCQQQKIFCQLWKKFCQMHKLTKDWQKHDRISQLFDRNSTNYDRISSHFDRNSLGIFWQKLILDRRSA